MATKSFGIKELNLLSSSGTPTLTSSSNLNLTANTVAITGNLTVSGTVNGGSITGGVTVQDEGSALSTSATTLNFVGSGVAASGTGATKTITINTGSGGISLANGANNRVITSDNANDLNGEANLTFNGSNLACSGTINNVLIGVGANASATDNIVLGNITTNSSIGNRNVLIGLQAGQGATGSTNIGIGWRAMLGASGSFSIGIGQNAGNNGGIRNISMGHYAGSNSLVATTDNIFIGGYVGTSCTGGRYNIGLGRDSLYYLEENNTTQSAHGHIAIGHSAMYHYKTGTNNREFAYGNVAIGGLALSEGIMGGSNVAIGEKALRYLNMNLNETSSSPGVGNVAIGHEAAAGGYVGSLDADTFDGSYNTCIGFNAAGNIKGGATANTIIGQQAATFLSTGGSNTCLGSSAGKGTYYIGTGSNNLCLGTASDPSANNVSNEITLGNSSIASLRCNVQTISSLSDARDKTDIVDIPTGLYFLNNLRPVKFKWQTRDGNGKDGSISAGFLAQDLQKTQKESSAEFLNLVMDNNPDRLEAREGQLIPVLVKAIQELSAKNDALEARIKTLEG